MNNIVNMANCGENEIPDKCKEYAKRSAEKRRSNILTTKDKRNLCHIQNSHLWSKEEQISVLKESGFKKHFVESGARWKPKYTFLDNKTDYSERGFM